MARFDGVRYGTRIDGNSIQEMYSNTKIECFGEEVQRRILTGAYVLSAKNYQESYVRAMKVRNVIFNNFKKAFDEVNILLMPVSPCVAFGWEDKMDPISMYYCDFYTIPTAIAGLGGMSVPAGFDNESGLPIGIQIVPKWKDEFSMFKIGKIIESGVNNNEL